MKLALIAAVARNGAIGLAGTMPWQLKADLAHFRRTTMGCPVVMGRKTWDSLPEAFRPLPGRRNVVVTRNAAWRADGAEAAPSLDAALAALADAERVFLIGGGELYAQALPRADELVLTEIDADFEADTRFPAWDRTAFDEVTRESHAGDAAWPYAFVQYRRRR
ncbi:MAG TPA: dihydrofolate reductase [Methylibium sp.]|jgi:dihydrofolate reductase|nr:dihydrofolate reductase [Methylibium sp.]